MRTGRSEHSGSSGVTILRLARLPLFAAALLAVILAAGAHSAHSSEPPAMRLDPAEIKHDGGPGFKVDVLIEGVTDLGGFEFEVRYDETRVNVAGIRAGPFLGSLGAVVLCIPQLLPGLATFACSTIGKLFSPSGSGVLASIDFTVKPSPAGKTEFFLQACGAADPQGVPIALNGCKDGSFVINPTPGPPPVGGIALDPDLSALAGAAKGGTLQNLTPLGAGQGRRLAETSFLLLLLGAGAVFVLGSGVAWYARRRGAGAPGRR